MHFDLNYAALNLKRFPNYKIMVNNRFPFKTCKFSVLSDKDHSGPISPTC